MKKRTELVNILRTDFGIHNSKAWMIVKIFKEDYEKSAGESIDKYCKLKNPTSYELFQLFSDLTGFPIEKFNRLLGEKRD